jgi:hypothetical protein
VEFWIEDELWSWAQKGGKAKRLVNGLETHFSLLSGNYTYQMNKISLVELRNGVLA